MGMGIALVAARNAKLPVHILDANPEQLRKGLALVDNLLKKDISKGKITEADAAETKKRLTTVEQMSSLSEVSIVIEAVSENVELKRRLFNELATVVRNPQVILATNTSSISITKIAAAAVGHEQRVIGMHFMNPVPVMKLVEIIPGLATTSETVDRTRALAQAMDKVTTVSQDIPGFIANRLLMPYINEAVLALQEGIANKVDIDTTMKLGTNVPMGPLTLADFIGLDTCLAIMEVLHKELGDDKYRPAVLLRKYVDAGWLGKKSGRGFYAY